MRALVTASCLGLGVVLGCMSAPDESGGGGSSAQGATSGSSGMSGAGRGSGGTGGSGGSSGAPGSGGAGAGGGTGGANVAGSASGASSGKGGTDQTSGGAGAGTSGSGMTGGSTSGGAGSGGSAGMAMAGGGAGGSAGMPSPTGARFPFPQNARSSRCTYPTAASADDVRTAYETWKTEILTSDGAGGHLRVKRPNSPGAETNSTVSEGIAYGLLLSVALDDQHTFDELWKYEQLWLNGNGLMHWYINAAGTSVNGTGGATDADEDMAWALIMADRQWGGKGTLDEPYLDYAKTLIKAIWDHEIDHSNGDFLLAGDEWGGNLVFNPSYFAPNEYRLFGEVSGDAAGWKRVIDSGYSILAKSLNAQSGNASNGLAPAWCDANGAPKVPFDGGPTNYQYDSARIPWRIGLDYCWYGEERAETYLAKISGFFADVGASEIVDGYDLDGTPHPDPDSDPNGPQSAVFVGTAAVGAMHDASFQSFVNDAYALVRTGELLARSRYYNLSWTALTLATLTGNLVEYPEP